MTHQGWFSAHTAPAHVTDWGTLVWLVSGDLMAGSEQTFGVVTLRPGEANPVHTHPNCEEIIYVVSGSGEQLVAEERVPLQPGEGIVVPRGIEHGSVNTGDTPLVVIVCCSTPARETIYRDADAVAY